MKRKNKIILLSSFGLVVTSGIVVSSIALSNLIEQNKKINYLKNFINNKLNNYSNQITKNNEFVKGVDISSYCEVIENFLFQNNIRKPNGASYKYNEIYTNLYNGMTLEEYINKNLFSYFDNSGQRKYNNLFQILKYYGINSLRIRIWNNPYDQNGNAYGGGSNDVAKAKWIIEEAKKYGFNDFLIIYHYSDFWVDPAKQFKPKKWKNLSENSLLNEIYNFTYQTSKELLSILNNNAKMTFQIGNEAENGMLWNDANNISFNINYFYKGIEAINTLKNENSNMNIKVGFGVGVFTNRKTINGYSNWSSLLNKIDIFFFSFYPVYTNKNAFYDLIKNIEFIKSRHPEIEIICGELGFCYDKSESPLINEDVMSVITQPRKNNWNYNTSEAIKLTYDFLNVISNVLPNSRTGFYYWEPANIMIGKNSWASKQGIKYLNENLIDTKNFKDINNWSRFSLFDSNAIAIPTLEIIKQFERNIDISNFNIYKSKDIVSQFPKKNKIDKLINIDANFIFKKNWNKLDINSVFIQNYSNQKYNGDNGDKIFLYKPEIKNNQFEKALIEKIKYSYNSIMYEQIEFIDFWIDQNNKWGKIKIKAKDNSFYYKGEFVLYFDVIEEYQKDTIIINNEIIEIDINDNDWYKKIINKLKNQPNWTFDSQIYKYLKIKGGINENNDIWLYDEQKQTNRYAEFFILNNDQIRYKDNTVNYDLINKNKIWVDNLGQKYSKGEHQIYFGIKKQIKELNMNDEWSVSTFSQIGMESWKFVDMLIYEVKIKII